METRYAGRGEKPGIGNVPVPSKFHSAATRLPVWGGISAPAVKVADSMTFFPPLVYRVSRPYRYESWAQHVFQRHILFCQRHSIVLPNGAI